MTQNINILIPDQSDLKSVQQFASELVAVGIKPTAQAVAEKIIKNEDMVSEKLLKGAKSIISTREAIAAIADNIPDIHFSNEEHISQSHHIVPSTIDKGSVSRG